MITSAILGFFGALLSLVLLLPSVDTAPIWLTDVADAFTVTSVLMDLPVFGTLIQVLLLALSFIVAWQGVILANWLYNKIRGSG